MIVSEKTRSNRQKQTAEVFTPPSLVNEMLDKLPKEVWEKGKTFCDPAVGNGNFLVEILERKIHKGHTTLEALKTLFGVDIMADNIDECRLRLLKICHAHSKLTESHIRTVLQHIVWADTKKYPKGSLDYDFSFNDNITKAQVSKWVKVVLEQIKKAA